MKITPPESYGEHTSRYPHDAHNSYFYATLPIRVRNQMRVVDGVGGSPRRRSHEPQGLLPLVLTLQRIIRETKNAIAAASTIPTYTTRKTRAPSPGASSVLSRPTVTALIYHPQKGTRPAASTFPVSERRSPCSAQTHKSPRHFEKRRLRVVPSSPRPRRPRRKITKKRAPRTHPHTRTRYVCSRLRAVPNRSPGRTSSVLAP